MLAVFGSQYTVPDQLKSHLQQSPFSSCRITSGREQKFNGLPGGIYSPIQELVLALNLYICLVDTVALVGRLQMLTTSLVQLWCVCLDPTPDAACIYGYAPFRDDLGDMLVSRRISKVTTHTQKDQLAGYWRPLNGLVGVIGMKSLALAYQRRSQTSQWNHQFHLGGSKQRRKSLQPSCHLSEIIRDLQEGRGCSGCAAFEPFAQATDHERRGLA